ncbi:zinc finger protein ZFAT isoform X2 [Boleophthalmus pectinirostris]|uniref:zinc finger protein ZFAT isoform X2 n=1 Tax=Boleophthalmus pectinirostris TaxID=150288 RepID=UPI000A1C4245|nr:zinc finger protein ZFAT isoform X2 [Boleophthalmus pectinirostris]
MDGQAKGTAVFMCRLCNLFSPSHSQLLVHCSQVHQQQGLSHDLIITLRPLDPQPAEKPTETLSKRKRGRPKGSTNKRNKDDSADYIEDNVETEGERKEQDEKEEEALGLECKQCNRTFRNRRQILKHICLKVEEEEEVEENDSSNFQLPKTAKRGRQQNGDQIPISKEKAPSTASKKSVIKVFLTEDEILPDVSKMVPVEEDSLTEEESIAAQDPPQSEPQEKTTSKFIASSVDPKTARGPSLKPTAEVSKGFLEYSITQGSASSPQIKIFTCEFCNKIFKFRHSLIAHLRTHTQEKPFKCPHCDYASAIKANLNVHLRKHTGDKFHCNHCSFTCISSGHLKVHIERVHLKVKQHCSFCKCKYSDVKNLLKHMERHHNLKDSAVNKIYQQLRLKTRQGFRQLLFHCPTCKRCFKSSQERDRHLLVHEPQPPFGCMLCEYAATKLSGLTAHVRKHFFLYVCSVCKGVFVSCHRLKTHLTESHPELNQDQTFIDCISSSYQLIQAGGGIWGQDSEKLIEQTSQEESVREEVIENIPEELQVPISQLEVDQNPPQDLGMGLLEHNTGLNSDSKVLSQSNQIELCQTLIKSALSEDQNKPPSSANLSEDSENTKEQEECLVSNQKQSLVAKKGIPEAICSGLMIQKLNVIPNSQSVFSLDKDKTLLSEKESEPTVENAFLQVVSSIQKTQLCIETLQQLRKVYGELECEYCGKLFAYKVHYNNHVRTHTKEHLQYCSQCNYSAVTKNSLNRHMLHKHSDLMLSCPNMDCKFATPDKYKLQAHVKRFHEEIKTVPCPVCNNNYPEHRLKQHMRKMHPDTVSVEGKGRMEKQADKCPYCDSYFLKNSNDFQQHIWAHEGIKPYTCNMCDYAGCRKSNLRLHMNRHKTEKIHLCDLCGKKFKSEISLKIHSRSHTTEGRKFKCSECDFATALKPSLARHMEQHARGRQAFQCAHCFYSCNKVGPLKRHYKTKHPDEKYPGTELEETEDSEAQEKTVFKCPVCDSVHGSKKELNRHLKNKHRLNVLQISFEETEAVETQFVPVEDEMQLTEVPVETLQDNEAVNILQQITDLNPDIHNVVTPMVAMAPGTVTVMEQIADEQEISPDQLMVVDAEEDLGADQVMVVEEAEGLEALTVLTQGDNTHHYIVYVQEQTVEIDNN